MRHHTWEGDGGLNAPPNPRPTPTPKHTPGPWSAIEYACHARTTVVADSVEGFAGARQIVAECSGCGRHADDSLADARLIAAAPDMLLALKLAESWIDPVRQEEWDALLAVRAAIAKAEG